MSTPPEHAFKEKSTKLLILPSLRTIYNRTFQCETPCTAQRLFNQSTLTISDETIFSINGNVALTKGDHVWSTPYWSDEFKVEFDAIVTEVPPGSARKNLFHLTTGEDFGEGGRLPAVFVRQNQNFLICYHVNDDTNYCIKNYEYELNKEYHFEISQQKNSEGEYWYSIKVNEETFIDVKNETPLKFEDVKLYLSDPWSETFAPFGKLSNLKIIAPGKYIYICISIVSI